MTSSPGCVCLIAGAPRIDVDPVVDDLPTRNLEVVPLKTGLYNPASSEHETRPVVLELHTVPPR